MIQAVYPAGPPKQDGSTHLFDGLENAQMLPLEILLSFISAMTDRLEQGDEAWSSVRLWPCLGDDPRSLTTHRRPSQLIPSHRANHAKVYC